MTHLASAAVASRTVVAVEIDGADYVVWRGVSGRLGSAPRWCPHLDWDLTDAHVVGDELVCPGHGWSFDCTGRALKRNELGRADDKGAIEHLRLDEAGGMIEMRR